MKHNKWTPEEHAVDVMERVYKKHGKNASTAMYSAAIREIIPDDGHDTRLHMAESFKKRKTREFNERRNRETDDLLLLKRSHACRNMLNPVDEALKRAYVGAAQI